jgi:hypothetical protein
VLKRRRARCRVSVTSTAPDGTQRTTTRTVTVKAVKAR